ncbi:MAG: hypothetical protein GXP49_16070 [Deltaproteobacteria bacterium]|nr:hypothetical protein [Deltaproteobacteria bacterium]
MSDFQLPDTLRRYRPLLLALEAIGWLHMTGKAKDDFLRTHGGQGNYDYTKWHEQETLPFSWDDLLKWVLDKFDIKAEFSLPNNPWPGTLTEFLTKHAKRDAGLLGLLQAGHGMASGIEKQSFPQTTVEYLGQDVTHMWLSTAFGHPVRNLLSNPPELLSEAGWKGLLGQIERLLTELEKLGTQDSSDDLMPGGGGAMVRLAPMAGSVRHLPALWQKPGCRTTMLPCLTNPTSQPRCLRAQWQGRSLKATRFPGTTIVLNNRPVGVS